MDAEVVQHIEYVPFGEVFLEEKNAKWNTPYLFTSKELDRETGLYYFGARYQDPKLGIFISVDPLALKYPGVSSYTYGLNNPVFYTDPTGMNADPPTGVDAENGAKHSDSSGSWIYNKATTTWEGQNGAKNIGNTIELNNVNVQAYKSNYVSSGDYGWNDGSAERVWNEYMPITSSFHTFQTGLENGDKSQVAFGAAMLALDVFTLGEGSIAFKGAGKTVETYALVARESGFYPVMTRGFKNATELVHLEAGEVWKYGITKNPFTRYTQKYLKNVGEFGLKYETLFESTLRTESATIERMMIEQYEYMHGVLPAGNKVRF